MIHPRIKIYLEISPKIGKKVGIHFYEDILFEIDLPLKQFLACSGKALSANPTSSHDSVSRLYS